ncbi:MAG: protein phosphatase 2C domain-containing protein [Candidatus Accumulibacter sp.]|jgi:serine/threonine protein phosphatase PrpC|nr:protein phosphatase 2C domain-containing protein [Accumulibacter sp.]
MSMMVDACVAQHQGDRKEQQDRVALLPHPKGGGVALAVVADGMGGHTGGALAAQQVLHTATANLEQFSVHEESPEGLLESSLREAHTLIKASRFINEKDPHSTAVVMLLQPGKASWAHCGDSRLYRFRGEHLLFRTTDHSFVEELVAKGRMSREQALVHPYHNLLTSTLGSGEPPRIDHGETDDLQGGDAFVLCSDGLWGYFSDEELGAVVATHPARQASDLLIDRARTRARGKGDNASLIVVKLLASPKKAQTKIPRLRTIPAAWQQ